MHWKWIFIVTVSFSSLAAAKSADCPDCTVSTVYPEGFAPPKQSPHFLTPTELANLNEISMELKSEVSEASRILPPVFIKFHMNYAARTAVETIMNQRELNAQPTQCLLEDSRLLYQELSALAKKPLVHPSQGRSLNGSGFSVFFKFAGAALQADGSRGHYDFLFQRGDKGSESEFIRFAERHFGDHCPNPELGSLFKSENIFKRVDFITLSWKHAGSNLEFRTILDHYDKKALVLVSKFEFVTNKFSGYRCASPEKNYAIIKSSLMGASLKIARPRPPWNIMYGDHDSLFIGLIERIEGSAAEYAVGHAGTAEIPLVDGIDRLLWHVQETIRECMNPAHLEPQMEGPVVPSKSAEVPQ